MKNRFILASVIALASVNTAHAGEACRSAKDMVRMAQAFYAADADRVDIINPSVSLKVSGVNGHPTPTQMLVREAGRELFLDIDETGHLKDVGKVATFSKKSEICRIVNGELVKETDGDSTSVNIGFDFIYRRTDGQFPIDEIFEGAKDGSKIMNGVAPGGLGFVVPGLKSITITSNDEIKTLSNPVFTRAGQSVPVPVSVFDGTQFILLKDIKSAKADALSISGDYTVAAMFKFDPETLAENEAKRISDLSLESTAPD